MTVERLIRIMAGTVVMISLALGYHGSPIFVSEWFLALTGLAAMIGAFFILDDPIFNGLAVSLIFGIFVSTLLTLVVIPVLYYALYRKRLESPIP